MTTPTAKNIVGVDIGGANLKYAGTNRVAVSRAFPLWRQSKQLVDALAEDLGRMNKIDALAVTMTGELADCFVDRAIGVDHIVSHTCQAAAQLGIDQVAFYAVDGRFRDADQARRDVDLVAAANWHALASFVAGEIMSDGTLIDIGSTTCDIIPIADGHVATAAKSDYDRLQEGSLVYVGCRRTPVCALVDRLRFRDRDLSVMNEVFATIDDARIVLGTVAEDADDNDTADGMPRSRDCAANRLSRMIGLDRRTVSAMDARQLACEVVLSAKRLLSDAMQKIPKTSTVVISGHGQDLVDLADDKTVLRLSEHLGSAVARCAPSYAVANLYCAEIRAAGN